MKWLQPWMLIPAFVCGMAAQAWVIGDYIGWLNARVAALESKQVQEVRFTLEDCPACKLRAEVDTQASPGSVPTLAEPGEYLPDPRGEDECR